MSPDPSGYGGDATRTLAERMLDRYGVGYICAHPEILFGDGYPPPRLPGQYAQASRIAGAAHDAGYGQGRECLGDRLCEAYEILRQLYAPHHAVSTYRSVRCATSAAPARATSYLPCVGGRRYF